MATETITQPGLPEKGWFTLQEVADRWGCTVDDLMHYGITEVIQICYVFRNATWFGEEHLEGWVLESIEGWYGVFGLMPSTLFEVVRNGAAIPRLLRLTTSNGESDFIEIVSTDHVNLEGLVITHYERDRFEREYRIGAYAGTMPSITEETEVRRLQRALGALVLGMANDAAKWRNGDKPNVSAFVNTARDGVSDAQGNAPHGYGESTLADTITKALQACQNELDR